MASLNITTIFASTFISTSSATGDVEMISGAVTSPIAVVNDQGLGIGPAIRSFPITSFPVIM